MKLELDLTPEEYQQLLECYFAGSIVLEERYPNLPDPMPNALLSTKINSQAHKFGKEHLTFATPELEGLCFISKETEEEIIPYIYE